MAVNVVLKSVWDDKGIKEAQKAFGVFGKSVDTAFRTVAVVAAAAGAAFIKFGSDSIKAASNLEESTNAVNVAFGEAAAGVLKIGETSAESLGIARSEFNQAAVRFSAFAERIVGQGGDVAGFIRDISTRATDFASVFNIDVAEALRVFQSGLSGEAEPLKRFGINLLDSEVKAYALRAGIISVGESMDETQKVQARYGLLLESTAKTAGDFANTSDSLANKQRILTARFTDLQAEVGQALLPAVSDLVNALADELLPVFEDLGNFLNSPQGKKIIEDTATAIKNFITFIAENIFTIIDFAVKLAAAITALKILKTSLEVAAAATAVHSAAMQLLAARAAGATVQTTAFSAALRLLPWAAAITGAALFVSTMSDYADEVYGSKVNTEGLTDAQAEQARKVEGLQRLLGQYEYALENGTEANKELAREGIERVNIQLEAMGITTAITRSELERMNRLKLDGLKREIGDTSGEMRRFADLAAGINLRAGNPPTTTTTTTTTTTGGSRGPSAFEQTQKIIKDTQKDIAKATERFNEAQKDAQDKFAKAQAAATKRYTEQELEATNQRNDALAKALVDHNANVARIQSDFANRQTDIIRQSINRLRDAFASAVRFNVADLFGQEEIGKSVDKLIKNLRDRLTASRNLVQNASLLASSGFSQTFIEQIVGAGLETGNELSNAILEATPETQRELQSLFGALESESETGMDSLAQTMFEKTGLATTELKKLFKQTQTDLQDAIKQAQTDYTNAQADIQTTFTTALATAKKTRDDAFTAATDDLNESLKDAKDAYVKTLKEIKTAFDEQIAAMKGQLGGLGGTIAQLLAQLAQLSGAKIAAPGLNLPAGKVGNIEDIPGFEAVEGVNVAAKQLGGAVGILIDEASDVSSTLAFLDSRVKAALSYADNIGRTNAAAAESARQTALQFQTQRTALAGLGEKAVGTVINVNVKTDSTQSLAMVGKTIGNTITKYVSSGGQVLVSPTSGNR